MRMWRRKSNGDTLDVRGNYQHNGHKTNISYDNIRAVQSLDSWEELE